jgi:hypothetical protein
MTDSLRPISSYDMPTDKQYEELNELGKEFLEERNVNKAIEAEQKQQEQDQGFIADGPGRALQEIVSVPLGGAVDAAESIGSFLDLSGDTLSLAAGSLFGFGTKEEENPFSDRYEKGNWIDIPDQFTPETKTGLGKLMRGMTEFGILAVLTAKAGAAAKAGIAASGAMKGLSAGTKLAGAAQRFKAGSKPIQFLTNPRAAKFAKIAGEGGMADFIMNDSEESNIANLIDQYAPMIPFSEALSVNEEDNPWSARIKSVTAGAGVNLVGHALVGFLKGKFAATKKAKELIEEQKLLQGTGDQKLLPRSKDLVGDNFVIKDFYDEAITTANAEGNRVMYNYIRKNDTDDIINAKKEADKAYAEGKGFRNSEDVDNLDLYLRKHLTEEDYEEAQRLFAGEELNKDITIKGDPDNIDPVTGKGEADRVIKAENRITDTRGKGTYYHGTATEIDKLQGPYDGDAYYGEAKPGLFGYGFYTTDDIITANKYKKKNIKSTRAELTDPLVYKTRQKQEVKFYDLDEDMSPLIYKELDDYLKEQTLPDGTLRHDDAAVVSDTLAELGRENVTLGEFIRVSRKIATYDYDMYSYEHAESILQIIEDRLKKEGFGGYTHQGGLYAGKGKRKHQVQIYWDPANQLELGRTTTENVTLQDYIDLAFRKGRSANDPWLPEQGMSAAQERANRFRKPDPDVNPQKFSQTERADYRQSTDTDNPYVEYVNESTKNFRREGRPVGSTNMSTNAHTRRMTQDDAGLRKFATEIMDNITEQAFRQIDNAMPFNEIREMQIAAAQEIIDIIGIGGTEGQQALTRYLNADLGTKKLDVSDIAGRKNFIFWDFDGDKVITITPQMKNALTLATHYMLKKAADIGTGVTMLPKGANATRQAMDILDHLQIAMVEMKKVAYMTGNALEVQKGRGIFPQAAQAKLGKKLKEIIEEEKTFTQHMKELIKNGNKRQAKQLAEIYSITDGRVTSLSMMQNYLKARLGLGGMVNGQKIPSQVLRELASVYYNSILSSPKTPIRAVVGTNLITVLRPFMMYAGAKFGRGADRAQQAVAAATIDAIGKAYSESWKVFKYNWQQGLHNKKMSYQGRFDLPTDLQNFKRLGKYAEEFGSPSEKMMYRGLNTLVNLNTSPLMRYSQNAMGAGDAAARTVIGRFTARIRAAQEGVEKGIPLDQLTDYARAQEQRFADQIFKMGDGNMMVVTDQAALMAGREATMTRDVEGWMKAFETLQNNPVGMLFFPFVRTGYNAIRLTVQHTPLEAFSKRYRDIMAGQNLEKYGLTAADLPAEKALMEGRIAVGSSIVAMASIGAAMGNIYGDLPRDKEMRDLWRQEGIKPHTMRIGNTLVSYRDIEPFNTVIATAANVFNYQHALDEDIKTELLETLTFMAAAAVVDKSMLAGVDDLASVLDPEGLLNKGSTLGGKFARSGLPYSALIGSIGDLLDANQKEANNMLEMMIKRDALFKSLVPPKYDMLAKDRSGVKFEPPGSQPLLRAFNFLSPVAITNTSGDSVKTTLYEMGYNLPEVTKTYKGLRLTSKERSTMQKYISMSSLRKDLEKVFDSKSFKNGFAEFKKLQLRRRNGYRVEDQEFYKMVQKVFRKAKREAYLKMVGENPTFADKLKEAKVKKNLGGRGRYDEIDRLLNIPK